MSLREKDPLVGQFSHLKSFPRENEALHTLQKIASLVKPIMRARGWKVGTLSEFYPNQQNLLGLNVNRGAKICLRLRYPGDKNQFIPQEQVIDTMLHELSHNVHGPHDEKFHALWDALRTEYEALLSKGYSGEGFLSDGHRLGGRSVPRDEARRIARAAAERRQILNKGSGQKLGGQGIRMGDDVRKVIADAAERRIRILKGCASNNANFTEREVIEIADEADEAGFKTQAEEDEANERAISQALWELVQEDEKKKYGDDYVAPSAAHPAGNMGGPDDGHHSTLSASSSSSSKASKPPSRILQEAAPAWKRAKSETSTSSSKKTQNGVNSRSLASSKSKSTSSSTAAPKPRQSEYYIPVSPPKPRSSLPSSTAPLGWTCDICTLHNPVNYLVCDACGTERPENMSTKLAKAEQEKKGAEERRLEEQRKTWQCQYCTQIMDIQWWTCSSCGHMKPSS